MGDTQKVPKDTAPNKQKKCENKKKSGETSFDSFPVNSTPFQNVREWCILVWKVILFLWCTQVKQKVSDIKIWLRFIQMLRGVDSQEKGVQPECSSNPHRCNPSIANRGFSPGSGRHKKKPSPTEQPRATRHRPPSPHRQTRPKEVERALPRAPVRQPSPRSSPLKIYSLYNFLTKNVSYKRKNLLNFYLCMYGFDSKKVYFLYSEKNKKIEKII